MDDTGTDRDGRPASMGRIAGSVLGLLQTRIELFAVELQEEKLRTLRLLMWISVATALTAAAVFVTVGALALFLWRTTGYAGLAGVAVAALAAATGLFQFLRRRIAQAPEPFAETVAEFKKDAACLHATD